MTDADDRYDSLVGRNVRGLREARRLTQQQLAERLARGRTPLSQQVLARIEQGARPIRLQEAQAIAEALRVDLSLIHQTDSTEVVAELAASTETFEIGLEYLTSTLEQALEYWVTQRICLQRYEAMIAERQQARSNDEPYRFLEDATHASLGDQTILELVNWKVQEARERVASYEQMEREMPL